MSQARAPGALDNVASVTDYEVRNRVGTLLYTSPDLELAKAWLREDAARGVA